MAEPTEDDLRVAREISDAVEVLVVPTKTDRYRLSDEVINAIARMRAEQREACAKVADALALRFQHARDAAYENEPRCDAVRDNEVRVETAKAVATAIRAGDK